MDNDQNLQWMQVTLDGGIHRATVYSELKHLFPPEFATYYMVKNA